MSADAPEFPDQSPAAAAAAASQSSALASQGQMLQQNNRLMKLLTPRLLSSLGISTQKDDLGRVAGFGDTPIERRRQKAEKLGIDREIRALSGLLPVNSQLEQELDRQEQELTERLAASLGPDFAATTSGQQALLDFKQRKANIIDNSSRQDIISSSGINLAKRGAIDRTIQTALGVQQAPLPGIGLFSNNAAGFGNIVSEDNNLRSRQFEADRQSQDSFFGGIGSLVGTLGGAALGGPLGAPIGSSIGSGISSLFSGGGGGAFAPGIEFG